MIAFKIYGWWSNKATFYQCSEWLSWSGTSKFKDVYIKIKWEGSLIINVNGCKRESPRYCFVLHPHTFKWKYMYLMLSSREHNTLFSTWNLHILFLSATYCNCQLFMWDEHFCYLYNIGEMCLVSCEWDLLGIIEKMCSGSSELDLLSYIGGMCVLVAAWTGLGPVR